MLELNHVHHGDCLDVLKTMPDNSVDSIVTDPPYGLGKEPDALAMLTDWMQGRDYVPKGKKGFMGAEWDAFVPQPAIWRECLRVLKPGGHIVAFAGTRTQHLMALGLQIAGFELRDMLAWIYGSGFPKSLDVGKAIDKAAGAEREVIGKKNLHGYKSKDDGNSRYPGLRDDFDKVNQLTAPATDAAKQFAGFGTALKPALETITLARKPLCGTVAANVQQHGTGALNIAACRIGTEVISTVGPPNGGNKFSAKLAGGKSIPNTTLSQHTGRWPANLLLDGSPEVLAGFPNSNGAAAPVKRGHDGASKGIYGDFASKGDDGATFYGDKGSAARFFYSPKASKKDRDEGLTNAPQAFVQFQTANGTSGTASSLSEGRNTEYKNIHPTVKPTAVMQWLCRLITPPGGVILDPFTGSGSTLKAAVREGFQYIGIEREAEYVAIARARVAAEAARHALPVAAQPEAAQPQLDLFPSLAA